MATAKSTETPIFKARPREKASRVIFSVTASAWKAVCAISRPSSAMRVFSPSSSKACFSLSCTRTRSEEHTSELQSQSNLVCRLLLEKIKTHASHFRLYLLMLATTVTGWALAGTMRTALNKDACGMSVPLIYVSHDRSMHKLFEDTHK